MKTRIVATLSCALLAGNAALAADMAGMKMDTPAAGAPQKPQTHRTVGVIKAMDAAKGTITFAHEPVPTIHWPAMTMGFKISKELAAGFKVGDKVNFEFTAKGMDATVTAISKVK